MDTEGTRSIIKDTVNEMVRVMFKSFYDENKLLTASHVADNLGEFPHMWSASLECSQATLNGCTRQNNNVAAFCKLKNSLHLFEEGCC